MRRKDCKESKACTVVGVGLLWKGKEEMQYMMLYGFYLVGGDSSVCLGGSL